MASPTAVIEKAEKAGVRKWMKDNAVKAGKKTLEITQKSLAYTKNQLKKANETPNVPQLVTMGVAGTIAAPIGAALQRGLANATANMTKPILDAAGLPGDAWDSSFPRKAIVHGGVPVLGLVIAVASAKMAKTKGMVAAGGIGVGLGLLIGSLVRSFQVPLQAQAPVEG